MSKKGINKTLPNPENRRVSDKTSHKILDLFYDLEEYFNYDETGLGLRVGKLVNKLQKELLIKNSYGI